MGDDRFKMIRRNSLRNEVDGSFEELEDVEDRSETPPSESESSHQRAALVGDGLAVVPTAVQTAVVRRACGAC